MDNLVRVRFAPSPTGDLHIGGVRTALFNYLFAKNQAGKFLIRIEDTDRARSTDEAVETILSGLDWLGLKADEEIVYQSKQVEKHLALVKTLLAKGLAYPCFATPEELEAMREEAQKKGDKPKYDGRYRPSDDDPQPDALPSSQDKKPFVIRLKRPVDGETSFNDLIVGNITVQNSELDDFIIVRSDGSPTYNFSVVADDLEMKISHVIRGMDHISNTPKQLLVYEALEASPPEFAHVPMILGPDKKKLSKRHGATSVFEYKKEGYLPEAFLNYMARLGWSHGDQEIFTSAELIKLFSLDKVSKSDSVFDFEKFRWVNAEHLKNISTQEVLKLLGELLEAKGQSASPLEGLELDDIIEEAKKRDKTILDISNTLGFLLKPEVSIDPEQAAKIFTSEISEAYAHFKSSLSDIADDISNDGPSLAGKIEDQFKQTLEKFELSFGKLGKPIRAALTGQAAGLPIPMIIKTLGIKAATGRLEKAESLIK